MSEIKFKLAAGTNVGLVRDNNEDNFVVCSDLGTTEWLIPQVGDFADLGELGALLVVADGMGGANAGEVASAIAIETIQKEFITENIKNALADDNEDIDKAIQEFMKSAVKKADLNILNHSKEDPSTTGMGTTIVMAWLLGKKAYICWCGDSRCYVLNKKKGLVQLSKDHSLVQELVDRGELAPELMHEHPMSNVITRCLGETDKRAEPDSRIYRLRKDDCIMLCSDGLCGLVSDEVIKETMAESQEDLMECKNQLISVALANGGYDNVTIALACIDMEVEEDEDEVDEENDDMQEDSNGQPGDETKETENKDVNKTNTDTIKKPRRHLTRNILIFIIIVAIIAALIVYVPQLEPIKKFLIETWNSILEWFSKKGKS